jgi:hypothetical protein
MRFLSTILLARLIPVIGLTAPGAAARDIQPTTVLIDLYTHERWFSSRQTPS